MSAVLPSRVAFNSSQERKLFPLHSAPDRLGSQQKRPEAPHLGPGCHDNDKFGTIIYELEKKPESKRGYILSARTAARFPPCNKLSSDREFIKHRNRLAYLRLYF